jgi:hypothetical protein
LVTGQLLTFEKKYDLPSELIRSSPRADKLACFVRQHGHVSLFRSHGIKQALKQEKQDTVFERANREEKARREM